MKLIIILALSVSAAALGQPNGGGVFPPPKGLPPGSTVSGPNLTLPGNVSVGATVLDPIYGPQVSGAALQVPVWTRYGTVISGTQSQEQGQSAHSECNPSGTRVH